MPQYNKAGGQVSEGLQNRRAAELAMWGTPNQPVAVDAPPPTGTPPVPQEGTVAGFDPVQLAQLAMPKQVPIMAPQLARRGRDPEYIQSIAAGGVSSRNWGGYVFPEDRESTGFSPAQMEGLAIPNPNEGTPVHDVSRFLQSGGWDVRDSDKQKFYFDPSKKEGTEFGKRGRINIPSLEDLDDVDKAIAWEEVSHGTYPEDKKKTWSPFGVIEEETRAKNHALRNFKDEASPEAKAFLENTLAGYRTRGYKAISDQIKEKGKSPWGPRFFNRANAETPLSTEALPTSHDELMNILNDRWGEDYAKGQLALDTARQRYPEAGYNTGGPVEYLRNGGRANITEEERERRRLARLAAANNVSRGRNVARQGPLVASTAPQQPAPGPSGRNVGRAGVSRSDPFVQKYHNMPDIGAVPAYDQPPVPGSDESILQNSSQAIEEQEAYSPGGAGRGGAPIELMGEEGIAEAAAYGDPRAQQAVMDDERAFKANEALRIAQLQQSATAKDAPGAEFIDSRVASLQDQMTNLGVPPESQGVGIDVNPASDPSIPNPAAPDIPLGPNDVGAIPGIDTAAPTPQQAADAVDPDRNDPRGKDQRNEPKSAGPDEQRVGIKNAQANSQEQAPSVTPEQRTETPNTCLLYTSPSPRDS